MPVVAMFDGIKIWLYNDDHPPPHFHADYAEHTALINIETLAVIQGSLPRPQLRKVAAWATSRQRLLMMAWLMAQSDMNPGKIP